MGADAIVSKGHFLILDADTAFVRRVTFETQGRNILFCNATSHRPYYKANQRLIGVAKAFPLSFVAHHMLFDVGLLKLLRQKIEERLAMKWEQAILQGLEPNEQSCFSEYELYGTFCWAFHRDRVEARLWYNQGIQANGVPPLAQLSRHYGGRLNTISLHSWSQ